LGAAAVLRAVVLAPRIMPLLGVIPPASRLFLLAGGLLIAGCFFGWQNGDYRSIFLLLTQPGLWAMALAARGRARRDLWWLNGAVVALMWDSALHKAVWLLTGQDHPAGAANAVQIAAWLVHELLWWWVVLQLLNIVVAWMRWEVVRLFREAQLFKRPLAQTQKVFLLLFVHKKKVLLSYLKGRLGSFGAAKASRVSSSPTCS
jgi:hypothetical protein